MNRHITLSEHKNIYAWTISSQTIYCREMISHHAASIHVYKRREYNDLIDSVIDTKPPKRTEVREVYTYN